MSMTAERVGRNNAAFRKANESVRDRAVEHGLGDERLPFICECTDERCTTIVRLTLAEYEEVRSDSTHFINTPGHQEDPTHGQVVREGEGYVVFEKAGEAARLAQDLDARTET